MFAAVPPLHRIEVVGAAREPIYTYTEPEMTARARGAEEGQALQQPIQRYKGLGEMDADQLAETTLDPGAAPCAGSASGTRAAGAFFELLMGNDVAPRKDFIVDSSGASTATASTPEPLQRHLSPRAQARKPLSGSGMQQGPDGVRSGPLGPLPHEADAPIPLALTRRSAATAMPVGAGST